jgi:O-antigen/teichoic acid export membrane protein
MAGLGFGAASFVVMAVLGVANSVVIARSYGVSVLGEYALTNAPVTVVWYLSSARERPAFVRELAQLPLRAPRVSGLYYAMLLWSFGLTLVVSIIGLVGTALLFHGPIDHPGLVVPTAVNLAVYLFITNTAWNYDAVFSGFRAGRELFWIRLNQTVAFLAFAILGAVWLDSVWGLVLASGASSATSLVQRFVVGPRYMRTFVSWEEIRLGFKTLPELIKFGLKVVPGSIANGVSNEAGVWVLGVVSTVSVVGAYDRAWQLSRRFLELNFRITEMLFPTLVERRSKGDHAGFDRALVETIRYCAVGMLLPAAAGGGAAHAVMAMFGPGFDRAADGLAVMLAAPALFTLTAVQRQALLAVDRPWLSSLVVVVRMFVTVGLIAVLTPPFGITGTSIGLLVGAASSMFWMFVSMRPYMHEPVRTLWPRRELLALALAYAAGFAAARAVDAAIDGLIALVPALLAGTLAFGLVLWLVGGVNDRDRKRLSDLRTRLGQRRRGRPLPATETG